MNTQVLPEGWREVKLGDIADIKTGERNNQDKKEKGKYPFFVRSEKVERIDTYSFDGEAILIPGEGKISEIIHHIVGRFDYHQRVYKISGFQKDVFGKFVFYYLQQHFPKRAVQFSVRATADSLRLPAFSGMVIGLPSFSQQKAIAEILQTWDAAIEKTESLIAAKEKRFKGLVARLINNQKHNLKKLGDCAGNDIVIEKGKPLVESNVAKGNIPVIAGGQTSPYSHNQCTHSMPCITISGSGAYAGYVWYHTSPLWASDCNVIYSEKHSTEYLYFALKAKQSRLYTLKSGGAQPHVYGRDIKTISIPLPPLAEQKRIASILTTARREIDILRKLVVKYRAQKKGIMQKLLTGKWRVKKGG